MVEADPLQFDFNQEAAPGAFVDVDLITPDQEMRRYWYVQYERLQGTTGTLTVVPPAGGRGIFTITFSSAEIISSYPIESGAIFQVLQTKFIDVPAGYRLRVHYVGGGPTEGTITGAFERWTANRVKALYGAEAQFDATTGVISYPDPETESPLRLVRPV